MIFIVICDAKVPLSMITVSTGYKTNTDTKSSDQTERDSQLSQI